ncbi:general secretion pathway protein GspK [Akkermansiaceae bacterium]|nr:general secretion pathway protein GspK [Akkermansiaceae bacterium]
MVVLIIGILSSLVMGALVLVNNQLETQNIEVDQMEATALAHKGLSIGAHPEIKKGDSLLSFTSTDGNSSYKVTISSEDALININALLIRKDKVMIRQLLTGWEIDFDTASGIADALVDWVDEDGLAELNGAESDYYQSLGYADRPHNRPFARLSDMLMVRGFQSVVEVKPDWESYFTLYGNNQLDIHEANAEVIAAATGTNIEDAQIYVDSLLGPDGIEDTEDDVTFASLDTALDDLNIENNEEVRKVIYTRLRLRGNTKRVVSQSRVGNTQKEIRLVFRQSNTSTEVVNQNEVVNSMPDNQ